jgi:HAD superfamily hydrolase (TIGR01509 family)
MRKINAFIFDLDGTLMDSEVLYVEATRKALELGGYSVTHEESVALVYGRGWSVIWTEVCERFPDAYDTSEKMENVIRREFLRLRSELDIRIPGSVELLKRLAENFPVVIVSGSPRIDVEEGIDLLEIGSYLDFYMGSEDYPSGKPDPACFLVASGKLEVPPHRCLVFEDSSAGVQAAKAAGMYCVALQRKNAPPQDLSKADQKLEDLASFDLNEFLSNPVQ